RLACGDSPSEVDGSLALADGRPHLMVTDPPYGVDYDPDWRNRVHRKDGSLVGGLAVGKVTNDERADWREAWLLFQGDVGYVWCAALFNHDVAGSPTPADFRPRSP